MTDIHPRYTTARMHFEQAKAYNQAVVDALDAQPSTAENPNEDAYQRGRFDGIIEYGQAIRKLMRTLKEEKAE